jgi:hypothetical protein
MDWVPRAFSGDVDTGSREENAVETGIQGFGSDRIRTEALDSPDSTLAAAVS